ncbi:MAG: spermidine/putrescine ABC transporter substrate-binding protein [Nocardioides sp.]
MPAADRADHLSPLVRSSWSRRRLLQVGLGLGAAAPVLGACGGGGGTGGGGSPGGTPSLQVASPQNPVTWPLFDEVPMIESGLKPEPGSVLKIYNYADYLSPRVMKNFTKEFGVEIELSTFNDTEEALSKIASGALKYDLYYPSYDQIGKLVVSKLVRPLNHDYVPNIGNCWSQFTDPWYDGGWQYSVPYTTYSTGVGWNTDLVPDDIAALDNPYDSLWDTKFRGKTSVIDDWHTCMAMVLLREGIHDINTENPDDIALMRTQLLALAEATDPRVTITMYNDLPAGQMGLAQMWSGDIVNAVYYLPKGKKPDILRYWFPEDGRGQVDNDLMMVLAQGENPVAAHYFINYLLDEKVSVQNFGYTGYQPPQNSINPSRLVEDGFIPDNLREATVLPEWFDVADRLLAMPIDVEQEWLRVWQEFKAGG